MPRKAPVAWATDLRRRLEKARLDLLALFRALDGMDLTAFEIPQELLQQLFELDADYAEALWALDQAPDRLDLTAMRKDTETSLARLTDACDRFYQQLAPRAHPKLDQLLAAIRPSLDPAEAYSQIPGRDPND
jgi:hypothetical protein